MKKFELIDKNTRTNIMYGVIGCLSIAVAVCVIKIATRPKVEINDEIIIASTENKEKPDIETMQPVANEPVKIDVKDRARIIEDNVNVRSGPGTDYERLGTAYKNFDFEMLTQDNSEWVKIKYDDKNAYVFGEYVEIVPMFLNDMGEYEEYVEN